MAGGKGLKMCRACRGLIDANATTCPLCGAQGHYAKRASVSMSGLSAMWTVNNVIVLANLLIYALIIIYQNNVLPISDQGSELDAVSPTGMILYLFGSAEPQSVFAGHYWRLISANFLHGGVIHILFNSFSLFQIGQVGEAEFGGAKYLCLYLITGIAGFLTVITFSHAGAIGASCAIFGIIGALAVYGYRRGDTFGRNLKSTMVQWIFFGAIMSLMPGISLWGHLGGLIAGCGLGFFLTEVTRTRDSLRMVRVWQAAAGLCVILIIGSFACSVIFARKATDVIAVTQLNQPLTQAAALYFEWPKVSEGIFDAYRQHFGASLTTLNNVEGVDTDSTSIRDRIVTLLRERQDQLQKAASFSEANVDRKQMSEMMKLFREYQDWKARKAKELGVPEKQFGEGFTFSNDEDVLPSNRS
jgi:rhomboid protease GluP